MLSISARLQKIPVNIVMQCVSRSHGFWDATHWQLSGVVCGEQFASAACECELMQEDISGKLMLWRGFELALYPDEGESYYFNLISDSPRIFVICRPDEISGDLRPFRVSLSYDEAAAFMEVGDNVFSAPIPAEIYRQVENYVLDHYVPCQPKKRKRIDRGEV